MRGKYHMMDWELQKWKQEVFAAITRLSQDPQRLEDFTQYDVCPANLCTALKELGWKKVDIERNGWENDTLHIFSHNDYDFYINVHYEGYTFELNIYTSEKEF